MNRKPRNQALIIAILIPVVLIIQLVSAIGTAVLANAFVFERAFVVGNSMNPTIQNEESLLEFKLGYFFEEPKRGDIVVFKYKTGSSSAGTGLQNSILPFNDPNEQDYIKRVIAVPGETVDIKNNSVYINGQKLIEPYTKGLTEPLSLEGEATFLYPFTVPKGEVFVLGDNRQNSKDSRIIGSVKISDIRGRALYVMFPAKDFRNLPNNQWSLEDK